MATINLREDIAINGVINNGIVIPEEKDPTVPEHVKRITEAQINSWEDGSNVDLSPYYTKEEIEAKSYISKEEDPTVPNHVKNIKQEDISKWNNKSEFSGSYDDLKNKPKIPTKLGELTNDKGFIDKTVDNLTKYYSKNDTDTMLNEVETDISYNSTSIKRLENNIFDSGEASGSSINIKDSTLAEFQEVVVDGVCNQETTIGKNVANVIESVDQLNQYNYLNKVNYKAKAGKYYDISFDTSNSRLQAYINLQNSFKLTLVKSDSGYEWCNLDGTRKHYKVLCTEDVEITGATLFSRYSATSEIGTGLLTNFQMEEGTETSKPTNFEPYTGGQASPNPNYPQEIDVIEENFDLVSCGKNLSQRENGNNIVLCENLKAGTYTFSLDVEYAIGYSLKKNNNDGAIITSRYPNGGRDEVTFTLDKPTSIFINGFSQTSGETFVDGASKYQLEPGDKATPFEPYQETRVNIELPDGEFAGKINDSIKDEFRLEFNEEDKQYHLYLDKVLSKIILNGSENWEIYTGGNNIFFANLNMQMPVNSNVNVFCNNYISTLSTNSMATFIERASKYNYAIGVHTTSTVIRIKDSRYTNVDDLKTWLSTRNTEVYYALAEPYIIDLGVIDMPLSYHPETNVFTTQELQPNVKVKYYRDFKNTILTIQTDIEMLKQAISTLTTNQTILTNEVNLLKEQVNESEVVE